MSEAATRDRDIDVARRLFEEGWSGGHSEAPLPFLTDDAVMRDILGHPEALRGHAEIVEFFAPVAKYLKVWPEEYFGSDDGIALTWMAYIYIDNDLHGVENRGRWLCGEGMSRLELRDGKVSLEIDYWKGPQGTCDDATSHFEARRKLSRQELGATSGA
jgi:hypothetical protein